MAQENFNVSEPNDGLGDKLRAAFIKVQANFTDLFTNKVDKEIGKQLSAENYTTTEKNKLANIADFAEVNVQSDMAQNDETADDFIKNKQSIFGLATTQIINVGSIGSAEIQDVVNLDDGYVIQGQELGIRLVTSNDNGIEKNYLFLAPGGAYGINLLQTVAADFQIFGDKNAIVQINDTIPSLTEVYSSQKVENELDLKVDKATGERLINAGEIINLSNQSGTNTGDNTTNSQYSGLVSNATHTGEVTGATALSITNNVVTNTKLAQVPTKTFKGRTSALTGNVEDLTVAQARADLVINNVENTTDLNKVVSIATQTALDSKQNIPRLVNANTTALNNEILHVTTDATITDIVDAIAGDVYKVVVINGLATIGGQIYGKGETIERYFDGTIYITTLPNGQKYIDVTANATVTNDWYLAIVRIKATSTITIPSGLNRRIAFTCFAYPTITATFVAGAGETVTSAKGLVLKDGTTNSVFSDGLNNVIIIGEMELS
jgi:hypothetical protein